MNTNQFVIRISGKRVGISWHKEKLTGYTPVKRSRKMDGDSIRSSSREVVLCVVRWAWTGKPYTGVAVLSPNEPEDSINFEQAKVMAMRRAFKMFEVENKLDRGVLWTLYRLNQMQINDPERYAQVIDRMRVEKERRKGKTGRRKVKTTTNLTVNVSLPANLNGWHKEEVPVVVAPVTEAEPKKRRGRPKKEKRIEVDESITEVKPNEELAHIPA